MKKIMLSTFSLLTICFALSPAMANSPFDPRLPPDHFRDRTPSFIDDDDLNPIRRPLRPFPHRDFRRFDDHGACQALMLSHQNQILGRFVAYGRDEEEACQKAMGRCHDQLADRPNLWRRQYARCEINNNNFFPDIHDSDGDGHSDPSYIPPYISSERD